MRRCIVTRMGRATSVQARRLQANKHLLIRDRAMLEQLHGCGCRVHRSGDTWSPRLSRGCVLIAFAQECADVLDRAGVSEFLCRRARRLMRIQRRWPHQDSRTALLFLDLRSTPAATEFSGMAYPRTRCSDAHEA